MKTLYLKLARRCAALLLVILLIMQNGITLTVMRAAAEGRGVLPVSVEIPDMSDGGGSSPVNGEAPESESSEAPEDGEQSETEQPEAPEDGEQPETERPEASEDGEQSETETIELSGYFGQFVTSAVLIGADGAELPGTAVVKPTDPVTLCLTAELDMSALSAIRESGDARYTVNIPHGLTARNGTYELKVRGKLLGSLQVDEDEVYFIFNTDEDGLFSGDEPEALKGLRLDIPCRFDAADIGGDTVFFVDLGEYKRGVSYTIRLMPDITLFNLPLPIDPVGDFSQFVKSVKLVKGFGSAYEMPGSFPLDIGDTVYLRFDLHDLDGTELISIMSAPGPYNVEIPSMVKGAQGSYNLPIGGSSKPLGTLTINADGSASFTFNMSNTDIFDGETAIVRNLWMDFACTLNAGKIGDNDRTAEIVMEPYSDTKYTVSIPSRIPSGELSMSKSGGKNADGEYEWTVTVNTLDSTDERDLVYGPFTDTTGASHALYGDVHITGTQYDPVTGDKTDIDDYFAPTTKDGNGFEIAFDKPFTGSDPITVTYKTRLTDSAFMPGGNPVIGSDETVTLQNDAKMEYGNEGKSINASWPLAGENVSLLAKGGEYDYAQKLIRWTVTVDTLGQDYEYLILYDQMADKKLKIEEGSVEVNGNAPTDALTWTTNADEPITMELPIWQGGANLYPGKMCLL